MVMNLKQATTGEVLYTYPSESPILVVMANDEGVRYIEPMNPKFDDNGNMRTKYISYESLSDFTISLGSITNISALLVGKKS